MCGRCSFVCQEVVLSNLWFLNLFLFMI
jgi:hypothetical protein